MGRYQHQTQRGTSHKKAPGTHHFNRPLCHGADPNLEQKTSIDTALRLRRSLENRLRANCINRVIQSKPDFTFATDLVLNQIAEAWQQVQGPAESSKLLLAGQRSIVEALDVLFPKQYFDKPSQEQIAARLGFTQLKFSGHEVERMHQPIKLAEVVADRLETIPDDHVVNGVYCGTKTPVICINSTVEIKDFMLDLIYYVSPDNRVTNIRPFTAKLIEVDKSNNSLVFDASDYNRFLSSKGQHLSNKRISIKASSVRLNPVRSEAFLHFMGIN